MEEKETIVVVSNERDGVTVSTAIRQVNSFRYGYPPEFLRWVTYMGQDKDQSPTGWGVVLYEPHPNFPGLFHPSELLDHWDGPVEEGVIDALMVIVCARLADGAFSVGLKKEHVRKYLLRIRKATRPTDEEKGLMKNQKQEGD